MKRREFIKLGCAAAGWPLVRPLAACAQSQTNAGEAAPREIGQVATLQGSATATHANAAAANALRVNELIFKNDALQTAADSTLGITFDDETTFSLSANASIVVDEFVYQEGGGANAALFTVARGTAAFVAGKVASTGAMKIATPVAVLGVRGTTGVIDVPGAGGGEPRVKLYADADGHVGRIEVFDRQGGRLGILTQGASAFALRAGAGGRIEAVPFRIPPQEAARDRGVLQRLFVSHIMGQRKTIERRQLRERNQQRRNELRRQGGPLRQNLQRQPGGAQQNRNPRPPGPSRPQPRKPNPSGQKQKH